MTNKKRQLGFTLVEMLMVLSIIMILSSGLAIDFWQEKKNQEIKQTAMEIFSAIKEAQTMALSGYEVGGISRDSYSFSTAECSGTCSYFLSGYLNGTPTVIKNVNIDNDDIIIEFAGGDTDESLETNFFPPRGDLEITRDGAAVDDISIIIRHGDIDDYNICLRVNRISGRMDIKYDCGV
jgi:prepilin-type N-terminal cleavage/methylation domain-containing protein